MQAVSEELETSLKLLSHPDHGKATQAFRVVDPAIRSIARPYVTLVVPSAGVEDVLQDVAIRAWCARLSFVYLGIAPWRGWVRRIASNVAIEWLRENRNHLALEEGDEGRPDRYEEESEVDRIAGNTWFCYPSSLSTQERDLRVLAAQLYFENGLSWQAVCEAVHGRPATAADRQALDEWLEDPAVLRDFAYRRLHWKGEELIRHLLGIAGPFDLFQLVADAAARPAEDAAYGEWKQGDILPIVWRYGFGLSIPRILSHPLNRQSEEELKRLFGRCREKFPFSQEMVELIEKLGGKAAKVFERQRVFKRLTFEYGCREEMRQKDVFERVEGPAHVFGYPLTPETLTSWISGHRLLKELRKGACT